MQELVRDVELGLVGVTALSLKEHSTRTCVGLTRAPVSPL